MLPSTPISPLSLGRWPWLAAFVLVLWATGAPLECQNLQRRPSFQHVDLPPDFQATQRLAMAQDEDGFLWFGGPSGLLRFDGYQMVPFAIVPPDSEDANVACRHVNQIMVDRRRLWLATDCGLSRLSLDDGLVRHWPLSTPSGRRTIVYRLALDVDGWLWIGTTRGLRWLNPDGEPGSPLQDDLLETLPESNITALHVDPDNTVWIGRASGLVRISSARDSAVDVPFMESKTAPKHRLVEEILRDSAGQLWVTTGNGMRRLATPPSGEPHLLLDETLASLCGKNPQQWFYGMANAPDGALWLSLGGNLVAWHPRDGTVRCFSRFDKSSKGLGGSVGHLLVDGSGTVWAATERTLDRLAPSPFAAWTYSMDDRVADYGWQTSWSTSPLLDREGDLWVASNLGLFEIDLATYSLRRHFMADDPELLNLLDTTTVGNLPDFTVLTLAMGPDGTLWAGTAEGLGRLRPGVETFEDVPILAASNPAPRIRSILPLEKALWVGTTQGLYGHNPVDGTWTSYALPQELSTQPRDFGVRHLRLDKQDRIWLGTPSHGLLLKEPQNPQLTVPAIRFGAAPPSRDATVTHLGFGPSGDLWVAYETAGIYRIDLETLEATEPPWSRGLDGRYITELAYDGEDLWLTSQMGLTRVRPEDTSSGTAPSDTAPSDTTVSPTDPAARLQHFSTRDGLEDLSALYGLTVTPDRRLLATGTSLFEMDLTSLQGNTLPAVRWTRLEVVKRRTAPEPDDSPGRSMVSTESLQLGPRDTVFSLELSALGFSRPDYLTYFYRLEGMETEWRETRRGQPFITYSHLPPGTYRLRARAALAGSSAPGDATTEATLALKITPPWWQSSWAYVGYVLTAGLLLWAFLASQRRQLRAEQQINQELRRLDHLKDEFLANTSHELRTPLFGITGLAEAMLQGAQGPVPQAMRSPLERITTSGRRLSVLLDELLDFAQLRRREARLDPQPVILAGLVKNVLELCRPQAEAQGVTLLHHVAADLPRVSVDPGRTHQVLRHLVDNGIKFSRGGSVEILAQPTQDSMLRVEVRDDGIGITEDRQPWVFNLFEQGDGAPTRQHGGTGLGLTIARRVVELQGGRIWIESTENEGCRVFFTLPTTELPAKPLEEIVGPGFDDAAVPSSAAMDGSVPPATEPETATSPADESAGVPLSASEPVRSTHEPVETDVAHVLVVDDEPVNQLILKGFLPADRFHITTADDGPQALQAMAANSFDLILLDVMMPDMSGFEVCRTLRRDHPPEILPILFITAKDDLTDRLEGFDAGANDYLVKPIARAELVARVDRALQVARAYRRK